jgi:hypothetical protein
MIGCLTAITILSRSERQPLTEQVLYIAGPWLVGFVGYSLTRRYELGYLAQAPAVSRMLAERSREARLARTRADREQLRSTPLRLRALELAVPVACVLLYLVWTGSRVDQRAIADLVLPVSTKGWLLILPYALLVLVVLLRDGVQAFRLSRVRA